MNIYNISKEFLDIFDELEENGGELTEELEERLAITQESFRTSVKDLSSVVKQLDYECDAIKVEQKRLKELYDRKQKVIERIKKILLDAINNFGDVKKTGVKYVAWETGEASIRKSKAVNVDDNLLTAINNTFIDIVSNKNNNNQLDVDNRIELSDIITVIAQKYEDLTCGGDDLNNTNVDLSFTIPMKNLSDGSGYNALKEAIKFGNNCKINVTASKTELKKELEENGACAPNLAKLVINENVQIK